MELYKLTGGELVLRSLARQFHARADEFSGKFITSRFVGVRAEGIRRDHVCARGGVLAVDL